MATIDVSTVHVLDVLLDPGETLIVGLDGDADAHVTLPVTFPAAEGAALVADRIRVEVPEDPWGARGLLFRLESKDRATRYGFKVSKE